MSIRGKWTVATLYSTGSGTATAEKGYWNRATAESHYNKMRGKVIAMVLYNPEGGITRSWNAERESGNVCHD